MEEKKASFVQRFRKFTDEVKSEMRKVTWPTRGELYGATAVVFAVTVALSLFLGLADAVLLQFMQLMLRL